MIHRKTAVNLILPKGIKMNGKKQNKHALTKKVPILAIALWIVVDLILMLLVSGLMVIIGFDAKKLGSNTFSNISMILASILFLIIMKLWYSPEYKGTMKSGLDRKMTLLLMVPLFADCLITLAVQLIQYKGWFEPSLYNIIKALTAGFGEEVLIRVTFIPIAMGFFKSDKRVWYVPLISGLFFGIMHLWNSEAGATMMNSVVQAAVTALHGFYYGALFVATGSALPGIILHSLYDFICFAGDRSLTDGIMTTQLKTWEILYNLVISGTMCACGVYALKKIGTPKILQVWKEKWGQE